MSTRNNVFNYDKLWLDCFHGYWSRDFYWPFGEYIYIYIYIYINVHLNLSQACTLPALHKKSYKLNTIEDKTVPFCMTPVFF